MEASRLKTGWVVGGILAVVRHEVILGVILILLAVLVGPGGVSLLS